MVNTLCLRYNRQETAALHAFRGSSQFTQHPVGLPVRTEQHHVNPCMKELDPIHPWGTTLWHTSVHHFGVRLQLGQTISDEEDARVWTQWTHCVPLYFVHCTAPMERYTSLHQWMNSQYHAVPSAAKTPHDANVVMLLSSFQFPPCSAKEATKCDSQSYKVYCVIHIEKKKNTNISGMCFRWNVFSNKTPVGRKGVGVIYIVNKSTLNIVKVVQKRGRLHSHVRF